MPTIAELLDARNEIFEAGAVTKDDLIKVCWQHQISEKNQRAVNEANRKKPKNVTYLSQRDREAAIILAAITQSLQNLIEEWEALGNRPKYVLKSLRCAKTMVYKAIQWLIKDVPEEDYIKVLKDVGYHVVGIYEYEPRRKK